MFVPETLMDPMKVLAAEYEKAKADPEFQKELDYLLRHYCGRPTPLYYAERWTEKLGGAKNQRPSSGMFCSSRRRAM